MAVDMPETFQRGGRTLIDFLAYCVMSQQLEPVFVFLVGEYQQRPTATGALAVYDAFCAPGAPARIDAGPVLPPLDLRLEPGMRLLRDDLQRVAAASQVAEGERLMPIIPAKYGFDFIVEFLRSERLSALEGPARQFDPALSPTENLPGGRMTAGQRHFVERIWQPQVRPQLVQAGFRRVANVG